MKKYKATANVLGLRPGEVFESDDPFYEPYARRGWIVEVADDGDNGGGQRSGDATGAPGSDPNGDDSSGDQGADGSSSELPGGQRDAKEEH